MSVTAGGVRQVFDSPQTAGHPVLQVLEVRKGSPSKPSTQDRYKLLLSDGTNYLLGMLASQLNSLVHDQQLLDLCLVQLLEFSVSHVGNRNVTIVTKLKVVSGPVPLIGSPQNISAAAGDAPVPVLRAAAAAAAAAGASAPPAMPQASVSAPAAPAPMSSMPSAPSWNLAARGPGAVSRTSVPAESAVIPIQMLNPYRSKWTIKARVTSKSAIRTWNNAKGSGKLFSVDLLDQYGTQIRCTMFKEAADKFNDIFEVNRVYLISNGKVKLARQQYTSHLKNDYELNLEMDAEVILVEDAGEIKNVQYDFTPVQQIPTKAKDSFVDLVGVVVKVNPVSTLLSQKTNREVTKRSLTVVDQSQHSVELTLWGELAEKMSESVIGNNEIICVKSCKVSDFGGCSLGTISASAVEVNPDLPEAHRLKSWWDTNGARLNGAFTSLSSSGGLPGQGDRMSGADRKVFSSIKDENLGFKDAPDYATIKGTVTTLAFDQERPPWYTACPSTGCNKKVNEDTQGNWFCEKCNKAFPNCEVRYILSFQASDYTDAQWLSCFNELAVTLLGGHSAGELKQLLDNGDDTTVDKIFQDSQFQSFYFRLRIKVENRQEIQKVRCTVVSATPVDYKAESRYLLSQIRAAGY